MNLRTNFTAAAVGVAVLAFAGMAQASTTVITGLYNTGVGADYASVGANGVEQHWTLTGGTAYVGGQNGVFPLNGPWLTENATSRWIGPTVNAGESTDPRNDGFYEYTLSFNLSASEAAGASFLGRFAADNAVSWIKLNNTTLTNGPVGGFNNWTGFSAATPAFQAGQNDLKFRVINFGQNGGNPSGLRVEFQGATIGAAVPEPGAWALMILGFGGVGAVMRTNRRRLAVA
jgi:hypothetical protein